MPNTEYEIWTDKRWSPNLKNKVAIFHLTPVEKTLLLHSKINIYNGYTKYKLIYKIDIIIYGYNYIILYKLYYVIL